MTRERLGPYLLQERLGVLEKSIELALSNAREPGGGQSFPLAISPP